MKANHSFLLLLLVLYAYSSQAQQFQFAYQNGTWNQYTDVLGLSDSSFVASEYILPGGFIGTSKLSAYNFEGEQLWSVNAPDTFEIMAYNSLVLLSDTSFGVLGYFQECCDCTQPEPFLEIRHSETGNLIERLGQILEGEYFQSPFYQPAGEVVATSSGIAILNLDWQGDDLIYFSSTGDSLFTVDLEDGFHSLAAIQGEVLVASDNELRKYDDEGALLNSINLNGSPAQLASNDQKVAILFGTLLTLLNPDLTISNGSDFTPGASVLLTETSNGFSLSEENVYTWISNDGQMMGQADMIPVQGFNTSSIFATDDQIVLVGAKVSEAYTFDSISHHYAALRSQIIEGGSPLWFSDLQITNAEIISIQITYSDEFITSYAANLAITVRNNGSFPESNFYLNHVFGQGICTPAIGNIPITETLNNQEEDIFFYPSIGGFTLTGDNDSAEVSICVFVTRPNQSLDLFRDNDEACVSQMVYLSTDDIDINGRVKLSPNPASDRVFINSDLRLESYRLFTQMGSIIQEGNLTNERALDLSQLSPGLYLLILETDKGRVTKKLMVNN